MLRVNFIAKKNGVLIAPHTAMQSTCSEQLDLLSERQLMRIEICHLVAKQAQLKLAG